MAIEVPTNMNKEKRKQDGIKAFGELIDIIDRLRSPGGCPWDAKQTPKTLKPYIIEEAYEVISAIDDESPTEVCEELGDLLLQIMLHSQIGFEDDTFNIADVINGISQKMITRHPHVFGDTEVANADEVLVNWEQIKSKEKKDRRLFDGLPQELPGMLKAARMGEKAGRVGFDWNTISAVREKVIEELAELDAAIETANQSEIDHELGDLLFAIAQWARHLKQAPEEALRHTCNRFAKRFYHVENAVRESGRNIEECDIEELESHWKKAKEHERS